MTKIKLNAWNSAERKMYFNVGINPYANSYYAFDGDGAIADMYGSCPTLLQFTGLLDKNGKEIYEGDIVVTENKQQESYPVESKYRGAVTYEDKCGWYCIKQPHDPYEPLLGNYTIVSIEIIGNIYEHPELLEQSEGK